MVGLLVDSLSSVYVEANFFQGATPAAPYLTLKYASNGLGGAIARDPDFSVAESAAHALALDHLGNVIVTGTDAHYVPNHYYGTYKLNSSGQYLWTNNYVVAGNAQATSIAVDQLNSVYVTGFAPTIGTNAAADIVTIKYDAAGNQKWLQHHNGPGNAAGNAIAVDNSGNVYVAGYETETNGFTSMILIKYAPVAAQKQSNGDFILHAYGSPGETFDIQASTNLQTWQDLGPIIADTNGVVLFDDTNAPLFPNRFYFTIPK